MSDLSSEQILRQEHELLGASFFYDENQEREFPASYSTSQEELTHLTNSVGLADLSGMLSALATGSHASELISTACASKILQIGECHFTAALTGDGALVSIPLLARTGDEEYLLWDLSPRGDMLFAWMSFLSQIEQGGVIPFEGTQISDASDDLVPLLLAGPHASTVLSDYTSELPQAGHVLSIALDCIQCLVAGLPDCMGPAWLIFVGKQFARILWRSFLSFPDVAPIGRKAINIYLQKSLPWWDACSDTNHQVIPEQALLTWHLCRTDGSYVGYRALTQEDTQ